MINEKALYKRSFELIIGPRPQGSASNVEPPDARVFRSVENERAGNFTPRISFNIKKTSLPQPNAGQITLYNISNDTRSFLEQDDMVVFLKAGFNNDVSTIFIGEVRLRTSKREGPNITYTLECGDAEKSITSSTVNIGLGAGSTNKQVIDEAQKQLGVTKGFQSTLPTKVFENGFSFTGLASDLLTEQTKNVDHEWNVQDGELRILKKGQNDGEEAVFISQETGLIGYPAKTKLDVKFTSLLNPKLRPGRAVKLVTKQFQGDVGASTAFVAQISEATSGDVLTLREVNFKGDSYDGSWVAECLAVDPNGGQIA